MSVAAPRGAARELVVAALLGVGCTLIVGGAAMLSAAAGLIVAGLCLIGLVVVIFAEVSP